LSVKKGVSRIGKAKRTKRPSRKSASVLDFVREGVERFILKDASIGDFQKAVRAAAKKGEQSHHPITGPVFRRIVQRAIQERKRRMKRASRS